MSRIRSASHTTLWEALRVLLTPFPRRLEPYRRFLNTIAHRCAAARPAAFVAALFFIGTAGAAAQTRAPAPGDVEVGGAVTMTHPLHGDFDFTAVGLLGDVRVGFGGPFAVDVDFERWSHGED